MGPRSDAIDPARVSLGSVPRRRRDLTEVVQGGEAVLYAPDGERMHALNGVATVLWHCLDGSLTVGELAEDLQETFGDDPTEARRKAIEYVRDLGQRGLLVDVEPPRRAGSPVDGSPGHRHVESGERRSRPATAGPELVAYRLSRRSDMPLVPAPGRRVWMDATIDRFAYRCLPLKLANEAGWIVESGHTVLATWDGGPAKESLEVTCLRGRPPFPAVSHFGHGILTWKLPYLFRTSPGYNLLMRGPANWPKDGTTALEGLIESDWTAATATMNWKLTRPGLTVRFDVGDPIAMLVPMRRGELEEVAPRHAELVEDEAYADRHRRWASSRSRFLAELPHRIGAPRAELWEKDYMQGRDPGGMPVQEHQRKLVLRPFACDATDAHDGDEPADVP